MSGDHLGVWNDLRALDPAPSYLASDIQAVAAETMQRVSRHVARIADVLVTAGLPKARYSPPSDEDRAALGPLLAQLGDVPAAFDACLRYVGAVWFAGDSPELELYYNTPRSTSAMPPGADYPDPLCTPGIDHLRDELEVFEYDKECETDPFTFQFAPDELYKANVSGSTHDILLPATCVDPPLLGVAGRPGITLVEYLRVSIAWGGFPGWEFAPDQTPAAVTALRVQPDF